MKEKEAKVYYGACEHPIPEEWYNSDDSSYLRLDQVSGAVIPVTTCEECKEDAENHGLIMDEVSDDVIDDLLYNPFEDDPAPETMVVFDKDGNKKYIEIEKE